MSDKPKEEAFYRHPRPQLPTKAALLLESRKTLKESKASPTNDQPVVRTLHHANPWKTISRLGQMVQGGREWHIGCLDGKVMMLRKTPLNTGRELLERIKPLAHPNIAQLKDVFEDNDSLYFRFDYARFTLGEVLSVHIRLEEPHILAIAHSVFFAIKHVATAGLIHKNISPAAIRICGKSGKVLLSDFDDCIFQSTDMSPNIDLELLGFTLLECMEGASSKHLRDSAYVRDQRAQNKIFGLKNGARWSGQKLLVDFLDDLFNQERPAIAKLDRPHGYVAQSPPKHGTLAPFLELVPLECFTIWRPEERSSSGEEGLSSGEE